MGDSDTGVCRTLCLRICVTVTQIHLQIFVFGYLCMGSDTDDRNCIFAFAFDGDTNTSAEIVLEDCC